MSLGGYLEVLAPYAFIFVMIGVLLLVFNAFFITALVVRYISAKNAEKRRLASEDRLVNTDYSKASYLDKNNAMKQICVPKGGIDPNNASYMIVNDGGKDWYVRSFSIVSLPQSVVFAQTFPPLMNFPSCTSSMHISRVTKETAVKEYERHVTILEGEQYRSEEQGNLIRVRGLSRQISEANSWIRAVEDDSSTFFRVAWVFSIRAESLHQLADLTDNFVSVGRDRQVTLSSTYGAQAEAYLSNAPFCERFSVKWGPMRSDAIKEFTLDGHSLSTIFNYQQNGLSMKKAHFLGYDMFDGRIVRWDPFYEGHNGYNVIIAGSTGSGKSTLIKCLAARMAYNTRFVAIDSQRPAGQPEGEYCGVARALNGAVFKLSMDDSNVLNIYELAPTITAIKDREGNVLETTETLELTSKLNEIESVYIMLIEGIGDDRKPLSPERMIIVREQINDINRQLFSELGIIEGDVSSLYEDSERKVRKQLPTIKDFYIQLLISYANSKKKVGYSADKISSYDLMLSALKERVRELYYVADTCEVISPEEYDLLDRGPDGRYTKDGKRVIAIRGSKAFYDGQSSFHISSTTRFTDIDITGLPPSEQDLGRVIAMNFVNEYFVKRNSVASKATARMVVIYDEGQESLKNPHARALTAAQYRTCRKAYVSCWLAMQQLTDIEPYAEAKTILDNTITLFLFNHNNTSKEYVQKVTMMTDTQFDRLLMLGGNKQDAENAKHHKGEVCLVESMHSYFVKVALLSETEGKIAETDPRKLAEMARAANKSLGARQSDKSIAGQQSLRLGGN